jgi:hypothetical protein
MAMLGESLALRRWEIGILPKKGRFLYLRMNTMIFTIKFMATKYIKAFNILLFGTLFISSKTFGDCNFEKVGEPDPLLVTSKIVLSDKKNEHNLVLRLFNNTEKVLKFNSRVLSGNHYTTKLFDLNGSEVLLTSLGYGGHAPLKVIEINPNEYIERRLNLSARYPNLASELKKRRLLLKWNTPIRTESRMKTCIGGRYIARGEINLVSGEHSETAHNATVRCAPFSWE